MRMTKKITSIVLAVMMVVSMMSVMAVTANAAVGDVVPESEYLTFTAVEAGSSVTLRVSTGSNLQYNKNNSDWQSYTPGTQIALSNEGDYVRFRGNNTAFNASNHVSLTGKVACSGNVMSLRLDEDGRDQGLSYGCFYCMFLSCTGLTAAPELPETTLADGCYERMFFGCGNLTTAPELPATILAEQCYSYMFASCGNLTTAPELPATTLAYGCYSCMFYRCERLTTAPELPATTLEYDCYSRMFYRCSKIKLSETQTDEYSIPYSVPSGGNGTTATGALDNMFAGTGGTFTGTPEIDKTYYRPAKKYTVTWKNEDGTTLKTDTDVAEGTTPTYDGTTPEKAEDENYTYTFSGWKNGTNTYGATDTLPAVTADVTYTAVFTADPKPTEAPTEAPTEPTPAFKPGYYVVGTFTDWTIDPAYQLSKNPDADGEYMFLGLELTATDQFKVVYTSDGQTVETWYPDGMGNSYGENGELTADGTFNIYFRPNYDGGEDWFYNVIYVQRIETEPTSESSTVETTSEPVVNDTYTVAGSLTAMFGTLWDASNSANDMTKGDGGVYSITYTNVQPENAIQLKVVKNHFWQEGSWGVKNTDDNYTFNVVSACDVTVTFDPATETVTVTGDGVTQDTELDVHSVIAIGNGEGAYLNGVNWDPSNTANSMTEVTEGVWELEMTDIDAFDNYNFKFAVNSVDAYGNPTSNPWANNFGAAVNQLYPTGSSYDAVYNGKNCIFEVDEDGSTVTLQLDLTGFNYLTRQGAKFKVTVVPPSAAPTTHTVTWKNWNGDVLETDENVAEGATPTYDGTTPTKAEDANNTYTFAAWDDGTATYILGVNDLPPVTGDVTYTAVYTADPKGINYGGDEYIKPDDKIAVSNSDEGKIKFGLNLDNYLNMQMLGIQKKNAIATQGGDDGIRFVTAVNSKLLQGSNIEDYGYIVVKAKEGTPVADIYSKMDNLTYDKVANSPKNIFSCYGSDNTISGDFGKFSTNTDYKYVTLSLTNTSGSTDTVAARFYVKTKDNKFYYADYIDGNGVTHGGMAFTLPIESNSLV